MIEQLTAEQEQLMNSIRDEYLERFFSCSIRIDKDVCERVIRRVYELADLKTDDLKIIYTQSPAEAQRVANELCGTKNQYYEFGSFLRCDEAYWILFYDFFYKIGVIDHPLFVELKDDILNSGIFCSIQFDKACIVSEFPIKISRNEASQLHCEDGSAIEFADGYKQYFWKGVNVPEHVIMNPDSVTDKEFVGIENMELKRSYMEILGAERMANIFELEEIGYDLDQYGYPMKLLKTKKEFFDGEKMTMLSVVCPSTERKYMLSVPPDITDVWEAVAWTFGKTKETYKPDIET
jgi:hypothetical protein